MLTPVVKEVCYHWNFGIAWFLFREKRPDHILIKQHLLQMKK